MKQENRTVNVLVTAVALPLLAGCASGGEDVKPGETVPVEVKAASLADTPKCAGRFVEHTLDHTTTVPGGEQVRNFEANGSGVAINDLDNDGDLDIVLGNHAGQNTILWNEGGLEFRVERMEVGDTRSVAIVDLDGDGWLDILLTRTGSAPNYWHNDVASQPGSRGFTQLPLSTVGRPLYAVNWGDPDADGDLDIVVNNLRAQARLFENQLCEGNSLQVDLFWSGTGNSRALGAILELHTSEGARVRQVKAASGYLSGDAARVHFGLAEGTQPDWLEIRWPDGEISVVEDLAAGTLLSITRH